MDGHGWLSEGKRDLVRASPFIWKLFTSWETRVCELCFRTLFRAKRTRGPRDWVDPFESTRTDQNGNLIVLYEVNYEAIEFRDRKRIELAQNQHQICYAWHKDKHVFRLSSNCSNTSEEEVRAIANIETSEDDGGEQIGSTTFYSADETKAFVGGGYDVFLKYNFPILMKIAASKREDERDWLAQFLKGCEDTPHKRKLLDVLARR